MICRNNIPAPMRNRVGLTLIELMLALAISAVLLTAVAVAMQASMHSYNENEKSAVSIQTFRSILQRMAREVRTADGVDAHTTSRSINPPAGSGVEEIHYEFTNGQLIYRTVEDGNSTSYILVDANSATAAGNPWVSDFTVAREAGTDSEGNACTKSVTVRLTLNIDGEVVGMTATASPRRNQSF